MADVSEILRLMHHAADLLEAQSNGMHAAFLSRHHHAEIRDRAGVLADYGRCVAASALAQTTLRMVATFMTETDGEPS